MENNREFKQKVYRTSVRGRGHARAFRPDGSSSYTATVPGSFGKTFCRYTWMPPSIARDAVGLSSPTDDDAPIWIEEDADGTSRISDRRYEGS